MSDVQTWSTTAASNNSASPNGFPEGMPPSGVNDSAREVMAAVAKYREDTDGVNTSSGTNTITLAASRTMTAYAQGDLFTFKAGGTNTGATTLNVDSLGAKNVYYQGAALTGGEITSGQMVTVVYDGTQFQLVNPALPTGVINFTAYKRDTDGYNSTTGTDAIVLGASQIVTGYAQGDLYTFKAGGTNTGATTINVDANGDKDVYANGAACTGGEIVSGQMYTVVYNGTRFDLINPSKNVFSTGNGTVSAPSIGPSADTNTGFYFTADTINAATGGVQGLQIDSSQNLAFNSGYGSVVTAYGCRVWVNFNGTGTIAIRGSGNVSSLTDNGIGDYKVNFTTSMPDANYGVAGIGYFSTSPSYARNINVKGVPLTGSVTVQTDANIGGYDVAYVFVSVFR